jgi:hypothetical protein
MVNNRRSPGRRSTRPVAVNTFRSVPSATLTAHTDVPPSRVDAKPISLSSGDQVGMKSSAGAFVNCRTDPDATSRTQML